MISPEQQPWFAALLEHSLDAVFLTRPNGEILYANPAACALFGYSLNELQTLGRSAVIDATDPRLPAALEQRSRTGGFAGTLRMVRKGGMAFPAEISSALFRDPAGEECSSVFVRDMSEREGREDALRKANEILAAALAEVKRLQGILPICSYCKRIRDDQDYWQQVDAYISSHSSVQFSHGICPACYAEHVEPMISGLTEE
jgi:PAS domain S-box-containing protein